MSATLRYKGKFIKKKVLEKKIKCIANMAKAKQIRDQMKNKEPDDMDKVREICPGRRVVELDVLAKHLKCRECEETLSLSNIKSEKRFGLKSVLTVQCVKCFTDTNVPTGRVQRTRESFIHSDLNARAILGSMNLGIESTALNKLLGCLNIPSIPTELCERYQRAFGPTEKEIPKQTNELKADMTCDESTNDNCETITETYEEIEIETHEPDTLNLDCKDS